MGGRALITGITGQDGSYLAEILLDRGYEVHGMVRRSSTERFERIEHLRGRITLHQGDLLDQRSLVDTLRASRPDEVYNLAAMSFVAVSWLQPTLTAEFTGVGVARMLEAMREVCPEARFYQASSSEMFGKVREVPQTEATPFYPRSPYGVAKVYGHHITVNYRESYDLFATSGILFNHECLLAHTPVIVREDGVAAVRPAADLAAPRAAGPAVQSFNPGGRMELWDGDGWTAVRAITATRRRPADPDHARLSVQAEAGVVDVTAHHHLLDADGDEVLAREVQEGDRLATFAAFPPAAGAGAAAIDPLQAQRLGALAARLDHVPPAVLNGPAAVREAFLRGCEGLTTAGPVLAQGLCWLRTLAGREASVRVEPAAAGTVRYAVGAGVPVAAGSDRAHPGTVRRIGAAPGLDDEWVYDIETASGVLAAGVGRVVVHNSPRRGLEFVTRKITWHAAAIRLGLRQELALGNLDAQRDWGFARDYVEAMWLMLQHDVPDDFVIATGEAHSVRECVQIAFDEAGVGDWERHVRLDPSFLRPAEVDRLVGDATKAKQTLGWETQTTFEQLIRLMTRADLDLLSG